MARKQQMYFQWRKGKISKEEEMREEKREKKRKESNDKRKESEVKEKWGKNLVSSLSMGFWQEDSVLPCQYL